MHPIHASGDVWTSRPLDMSAERLQDLLMDEDHVEIPPYSVNGGSEVVKIFDQTTSHAPASISLSFHVVLPRIWPSETLQGVYLNRSQCRYPKNPAIQPFTKAHRRALDLSLPSYSSHDAEAAEVWSRWDETPHRLVGAAEHGAYGKSFPGHCGAELAPGCGSGREPRLDRIPRLVVLDREHTQLVRSTKEAPAAPSSFSRPTFVSSRLDPAISVRLLPIHRAQVVLDLQNVPLPLLSQQYTPLLPRLYAAPRLARAHCVLTYLAELYEPVTAAHVRRATAPMRDSYPTCVSCAERKRICVHTPPRARPAPAARAPTRRPRQALVLDGSLPLREAFVPAGYLARCKHRASSAAYPAAGAVDSHVTRHCACARRSYPLSTCVPAPRLESLPVHVQLAHDAGQPPHVPVCTNEHPRDAEAYLRAPAASSIRGWCQTNVEATINSELKVVRDVDDAEHGINNELDPLDAAQPKRD
ncbi:hypothetical protein B0H11DRAFT_2206674 [Mycena galericulata]|nr:hypothetical protein B0H11DRAFT_2206674 [Mycena galericulata]